MHHAQPNNPLHNTTLQAILEYLVDELWWEKMGGYIRINCFLHDPSIKSSLTFLRKNPDFRSEVERLYLWAKNRKKI